MYQEEAKDPIEEDQKKRDNNWRVHAFYAFLLLQY